MGEFKMPSLGADMEDGTLLLWKVHPGDRVKRGDIIAEVGTDKGDIEVEVFEDGVVKKLLVEEGTDVPVGQVLAIIENDETDASPAPEAKAARVKASPVAKKLAEERGLDLHTIHGTGPAGAITRDDVEKATGEKRPARPKTEKRPSGDNLSKMRHAIAVAMARSNREIPHYYLETRIDLKRALDWLAEENKKLPLEDRMLPVVLLLKAVARSLKDVPELNGFWVDDGLQKSEAVHIGFAIALRKGGLVTPAIHDVDQKTLSDIMKALEDLIPRARVGRLRSSEMTDATITVTSLGELGVETVHGVIYPPQVGLVGLGKILEQPWAENGMLGIRPVLSATIAGDHRATDGRRGAQFLDALARHLREPEKL